MPEGHISKEMTRAELDLYLSIFVKGIFSYKDYFFKSYGFLSILKKFLKSIFD